MTIRFETLTSTIDAAPGETVDGKIRLSNESGEDATVAVRVIGVGPGSTDTTSGGQVVHLPAGETLDVDVPIAVPDLLGIGQHAAAFEVRTGLQGSQPLLGSFTLSVPSVERILMETVPSTIRGKRRPKFILDLTNNEAQPVTFVVDGSANNVRVRFEEDHFQLAPGERASTQAKVRGPRRVFGQPTQHNLLLSARGVASSTAITTPYVQRPLIASRIRSIVAAITVVALWAGGMVGLYRWDRSQQAESTDQSSLTVDADGTAQELASPSDSAAPESDPDSSTDSGSSDNNTAEPANADNTSEPANSEPANGDSDSDSGGSATSDSSDNAESKAESSDNPADNDQASESGDQAAASTPISTTVTGTITLATDDSESSTDALDGVVIKLRELQLGEAAPAQSVPQGFAARSADQPTKLWSARRSTAASELGRIRQTVPVTREGLPDGLGIWLFSEVQLQRTYELAFQKEGFQSQSFVIEPSDDGTLVKVDVNLAPGEGSIVGTLTGPPAGQRNAAISITDGTIEYATTAASDTGSWQIEGLSTPAVYTLTASLPGYGTVVQQVTLQTGEQDLATNVVLEPGVATVRGQVFGPEGGVGGAVITIAGRGEPRTTTTLTEGNIGAYSVSGFDIDASNPQAATITVEQDGFNRESTTRALNRSDVSGVNFLLTGDRLRLSGVVRSSDDKQPIAGASLELSTGDLIFNAQTSSGLDPGEFDVADLPPGDYVITVAKSDYVTSYEFVTLVEGIAPDRLDVTLQGVDPNDALDQLKGDLIVRVVDPEGATQGTREVANATVRLFETASGKPVPLVQNESSYEVRYTVPIGTYTVAVTRDEYNPAPRREVTVGLSGETIEVELDKKLKASSRVIDSVSGLPLQKDEYTLSVLREPDLAGEAEQPFAVIVNDDGEWETDKTLPSGSYRIETNAVGYRIRSNQVLDATLNGADRVFRFEIRASLTEKLVLNDIRADPYAKVSGRVFKPTVDTLGVVRFEPIDEPLLAVTMTCAGRSPGAPAKTATATLSDELSNPGLATASTQYDTFTFARETFAEQQLDNANCTINKASAGTAYTEVTAISFSNLSVSNGSAYTDRVVNFALAKPPKNDFKGTTFWIDPRDAAKTPRPVGGVTLTSLGAGAIVGFQANISGPDQTELEPEPTFAVLQATSENTTTAAKGTWEFDRLKNQIIGETLYRVEAPGGQFLDGTIKVTVDGEGNRTVDVVAGVKITGNDADGFNIEMLPPEPGTLLGKLNILTTDAQNSAKVTVDGYAPANNPSVALAPDESGKFLSGDFEYSSAAAGTWTVNLTAPSNHEFVNRVQTPPDVVIAPDELRVDVFVPPNGDSDRFTRTLVELGQINLTLQSSTGSSIPAPTVTAASTDGGVQPSPSVASVTQTSNVAHDYEIVGFPVTVGNDDSFQDSTFDVTFQAAGFDNESASVVYTNSTPAVSVDRAFNVPFVFQAGSKIPVTVTMEPYGSIRGRIQGVRASGITAGLDINEAGGEAIVTIAYRKTNTGTFALSDIIPTKPTGSALGTFEFIGPPGDYQLTVAHPEFKVLSSFEPPVPNPPSTSGFNMVNEVRNEIGTTSLDELRTDLFLNAYTSGAKDIRRSVKVTLAPFDQSLAVIEEDCLAADGECTITGLAAVQQYTLTIESHSTADRSFPAVTTIVAPRTRADHTKFVTVTAVLPPLDASITVEVIGENSKGDPVTAPGNVVVTSEFIGTGFQISVNDNDGEATKTNEAGEDVRKLTLQGGTADGPSKTNYVFGELPSGTHTVTATQQAAGYRSLNNNSQNVTVVSTHLTRSFTYIAENVTVTADLTDNNGGGDYPNLSWTLLSPSQASSPSQPYNSSNWIPTSCAPDPTLCPSPAWSFNEATNRLTITGVPPELGNFELTVDDDLHAATKVWTGNIPVQSDVAGTFDIGTVEPIADAARLSGSVTQFDGINEDPLAASGVITLKDSANKTVPNTPVAHGNGQYQRTVPLLGYTNPASTFNLLVSNTGYVPIDRQVSLRFGSVTKLDVNIDKLATVKVTLARNAAGTLLASALPPGLDVHLTTKADQKIYPVTLTPTDSTLSFEVPGDVDYRINATATDYDNTFTVPTNGFFRPAVGLTTEKVVALPRLVLVTVDGPTAATPTVTIDGAVHPITPNSTSPYKFEFAVGSTSSIGSGTVVVGGDSDFRPRLYDIGDTLFSKVAATLKPTVTASGDLTMTQSDAQGTTAVPVPKGVSFEITTPSLNSLPKVSLSGVTDKDGTYSRGGLTTGPDGEARTWSIEFDAPGYGTRTLSLGTVSSTSVNTIEQDVNLVPAVVPVKFTVLSSAGGYVAGAVVTVTDNNNATFTSAATSSGVVTMNLPENLDTPTFTIAKAGFVTSTSATLTGWPITSPRPTQIDEPDVTLAKITYTVNGTVNGVALSGTTIACPGCLTASAVDANGGFTVTFYAGTHQITATTTTPNATNNPRTTTITITENSGNVVINQPAPVYAISGTVTGNALSGTAVTCGCGATDTNGADNAFTFAFIPGNYTITATNGTRTSSVGVTVNDDGTTAPAPITLALPD
jgi:hypothetical protein